MLGSTPIVDRCATIHGLPRCSRFVAVLATLLGLGCHQGSAPSPTEAPPPVVTVDLQTDTADRIRALGSGAALVFVVDPHEDSWARAWEQVLAVRAEVGADLAITSLDDPVLGTLHAFGIPLDATQELQGWDRDRRVVLAIGDPIVGGPPGAPPLIMMDPDEVRLRHVIALPASDVALLIESLDRALEPAGEAWPELVSGVPGARARTLRGQGAIALFPDTEAVRIVAITHAELREPAATLDATLADLQPSPDPVEDTPAIELAARPEVGLALHVRPWRLRVLAAMLGMHAAHREVSKVEPPLRRSALAAGLNIVLGCERMLGEPREVDDWTLGLAADGPRSMAMVVGSLTERGRERMRAMTSEAEPLGLRRDDLVANTFIDITAAPREHPATEHELQACGRLAPWILGMGSPSTWGDRAVELAAGGNELGASIAEVLRARPLGLQITALPTARGLGSALAAILPHPEEAQRLAQELERRGARVHVTTRGTEHVVLAGLGLDPDEVFDPDVVGERRGFLEVELRQEGLPFTRGRMGVVDGMIFGEVTGPAGLLGPPMPLTARRAAHGPALGEADPAALECLLGAEAVIVPALVRMNDPYARHSTWGPKEWLTHAEGDIGCALAHPATKDAMGLVAGYAVSEAAATLARIGEVEAATRFLSITCKQPGEGCVEWSRLRTLPQVSLPRVESSSSCVEKTFKAPFGVPVLIGDGRITIDGEPVRAERDALVAALERVRPPAPRSLVLDLLVDRDVEPSTVVPVLEAMASTGIDIVNLGAMTKHGFMGIGLHLKRATRTNLPSRGSWEDFVDLLAEHCELATVLVAHDRGERG